MEKEKKEQADCLAEQRKSNYEIVKEQMQKEFLKYNQDNMIRKFNLESDADYIYLKFVNCLYRVNRRNGYVEWSENGFKDCHEANHNEAMTIYDILCYSQQYCQISGEFTMMHNLSVIMTSTNYVGKGIFAKEAQMFDHNEKMLSEACEKLGGIKDDRGDVSYKIPVFKDMAVILRFWNSDDELPCDLQVFCDKNTLQFMHYETVWFMVSHIIGQLKSNI